MNYPPPMIQPAGPPPGPVPANARRSPDPADVRVAIAVTVALAVIGALAGLVWSAWSPPGPPAEVLGGGTFAVIDEEGEAAIAGDGRFLVITAAVGLVAAVLVWVLRRRNRGAAVLFGLCVGAGAGGLLTELVGHLSGSGSFSGRMYRLTDGSTREITLHLPLSLHLQALLFVEPAVVALVYGVLVAFTERDDLGRPDPVRDMLRGDQRQGGLGRPVPAGPAVSVDAGGHPQYSGGYGDTAGAPQQREFPPQ